MRMKQIVALSTVAIMLTACGAQNAENARQGGVMGGGGITKSDVGTVGGAVAGAVIGSKIGGGSGRTAAIAIGTLLGAGVGHEIGASLDRADMSYYNKTQQQALETAPAGQTLPWNNPESGNSGSFTPSNYYQTAEGSYCREFNQTINVGGKTEQAYGTACRQPDGSWKVTQ
ncbi:MAG: glycine zipper 2TM domain-containing protein [Alphaproteobacteria bacterium]|nr:glycine zipper 2TM domain-containing protein [Alphaproteobacteria bacterium]